MTQLDPLDSSAPVETVALNKRDPRPHDGSPRPLRLRPQSGGPDLLIDRNGTIAGRQLGIDIPLPSPDVSRRHCRFDCYDGVWWVCDLGSLNGVFVNGRRVPAAELHPGDQLDVGAFSFTVGGALEHEAKLAILRSILAELDNAPAGAASYDAA